ncbi:hypothetical protein [Actinoplanes sp. NPDC051851]|uniref:hypothetical protein n=1 Tax=Actinoplanes sp. NPDC051851 TaxID=3154753 RepID=UPI0034427B8E
MKSMTRMVIGAGAAVLAGAGLGAAPASAVPRDTSGVAGHAAAVTGKYEVWDYYKTELECRTHGFAGKDDGRWISFKCSKGSGKYQKTYVLYVEYAEGQGAPDEPQGVPYFAPIPGVEPGGGEVDGIPGGADETSGDETGGGDEIDGDGDGDYADADADADAGDETDDGDYTDDYSSADDEGAGDAPGGSLNR